MQIELSTAVVAAVVVGGTILLIGLEIVLEYLWRWLTRRRQERTVRYPWSERTGL